MLAFSEIRRIRKIFQNNGWNPETKIYHKKKQNLFDAVSDFVARIKPELREIVFELLAHYEVINEYYQYGRCLCDQFIAKIDTSKQYYVSPIAKPDAGRIKSGHNFCYDIISHFPSNLYQNVKFVDSPYSSDIFLDENTVIVFTDDFIGTGEQFFEMYDAFVNKIGKPKDCILLVIRIQEQGFAALSDAGIKVFADQIREKAITSGRATGTMSIEQAREKYLQIENEVMIPPFTSFGFGQSEAIVTMKRTPDNTLPIFWVDQDIGGQEWPAPFPMT